VETKAVPKEPTRREDAAGAGERGGGGGGKISHELCFRVFKGTCERRLPIEKKRAEKTPSSSKSKGLRSPPRSPKRKKNHKANPNLPWDCQKTDVSWDRPRIVKATGPAVGVAPYRLRKKEKRWDRSTPKERGKKDSTTRGDEFNPTGSKRAALEHTYLACRS